MKSKNEKEMFLTDVEKEYVHQTFRALNTTKMCPFVIMQARIEQREPSEIHRELSIIEGDIAQVVSVFPMKPWAESDPNKAKANEN